MWMKVSDPDVRVNGGRVATLEAAPAAVVRLFGPATHTKPSGDGKVDRMWVISHPEHGQVSVYAYKATSCYEGSGPEPDDFWASTRPYPLSVGGHDKGAAADFVAFFEGMLLADANKGD